MSTLPLIPRWQSALKSISTRKFPLTQLNKYIYPKGSTVKVYAGGLYPMVLTADPDFIQHILQKSHRKYHKLNRQYDRLKHFWGKGLLTNEGSSWLKQRRLIQPGFHMKKLKEIMKLMDRVSEDFLEKLDQELTQNPTLDIAKKMQELTCRVIANTIFSTNLKEEEFQIINKNLPRVQAFILRSLRQPYLNWWHRWSGQIKAHEKLRDEINAIIQSYIHERRNSAEEFDDLLQMLLDIRYADTGKGMTDSQLIDEVNILFIAGHETSGYALSWALYLLNKHPDVMQKLREEVNQNIPDDHFTFESLTQLPYTQQVIEETLRLYPPAWANSRVAIEDDEFKGIPIKKGTNIAAYIYGLHHSPDLWENPESFQPERFTKEKKKARHPYAFLPFGGGPRLCIGKQFALTEIKLILAKMVKRYEMKLTPDQQIEASPLILLQPNKGIQMEMSVRQSQAENAHPEPFNSVSIPINCPYFAAMQSGTMSSFGKTTPHEHPEIDFELLRNR